MNRALLFAGAAAAAYLLLARRGIAGAAATTADAAPDLGLTAPPAAAGELVRDVLVTDSKVIVSSSSGAELELPAPITLPGDYGQKAQTEVVPSQWGKSSIAGHQDPDVVEWSTEQKKAAQQATQAAAAVTKQSLQGGYFSGLGFSF